MVAEPRATVLLLIIALDVMDGERRYAVATARFRFGSKETAKTYEAERAQVNVETKRTTFHGRWLGIRGGDGVERRWNHAPARLSDGTYRYDRNDVLVSGSAGFKVITSRELIDGFPPKKKR